MLPARCPSCLLGAAAAQPVLVDMGANWDHCGGTGGTEAGPRRRICGTGLLGGQLLGGGKVYVKLVRRQRCTSGGDPAAPVLPSRDRGSLGSPAGRAGVPEGRAGRAVAALSPARSQGCPVLSRPGCFRPVRAGLPLSHPVNNPVNWHFTCTQKLFPSQSTGSDYC